MNWIEKKGVCENLCRFPLMRWWVPFSEVISLNPLMCKSLDQIICIAVSSFSSSWCLLNRFWLDLHAKSPTQTVLAEDNVYMGQSRSILSSYVISEQHLMKSTEFFPHLTSLHSPVLPSLFPSTSQAIPFLSRLNFQRPVATEHQYKLIARSVLSPMTYVPLRHPQTCFELRGLCFGNFYI